MRLTRNAQNTRVGQIMAVSLAWRVGLAKRRAEDLALDGRDRYYLGYPSRKYFRWELAPPTIPARPSAK